MNQPQSRLRVLSLSTLFPAPPRPGFGQFVRNQMCGVIARGDVDLTIINPIGLPPWPLVMRAPYPALAACPALSDCDGAPVHHVPFRTVPVIGGTGNPARIVRAVLPLVRRLHAKAPFDLVDAQFFFPDGPAAMALAAALGVPFSVKARGSDIHLWSTRPAALAQMRRTAAAARMLAVSAALREDMIALGFPAERIAVHYTGLDRDRFVVTPRAQARASVADQFGLPANGPLLVCPGALIPIKGQALALQALAALPGAHLALAGSGPDDGPLRALAEKFGLAARVHFLGQVPHDHLPVLMAAAQAVVLPSEREGLANVWIEALACGTPLVIPPIGGAREVLRNPAAGRLAAREPGSIADAVRSVLADQPEQSRVAATVAGFSWEANSAQLVAFWARLVDGNCGTTPSRS